MKIPKEYQGIAQAFKGLFLCGSVNPTKSGAIYKIKDPHEMYH